MNKPVQWTLLPASSRPVDRVRCAAARAVQTASAVLAALARHLRESDVAAVPSEALPHFEFHAEAGAPEGALYVDGIRIGVLEGVTRL